MTRRIWPLWLPTFWVALSQFNAFADDIDAADAGAPLPVRNLTPVTINYGLPRALGARLTSAPRVDLSTEIVNHFTAKRDPDTYASFDGETAVFSLGYRQPLGAVWEIGAELPYLVQSGGFTDVVIETFHEALGFPDNGRPRVPRNRLEYIVIDDGGTFLDFSEPQRGFGDLKLLASRQLLAGARHALALRASLKIPTGDPGRNSGSGAADAAMMIEYSGGDARVGTTLAGGFAYLGKGQLTPARQNRLVGVGHFGLSYRVNPNLVVKGQIDAHSEVLDTGLAQVGGAAVQGSVGIRAFFNRRLSLDLGLVEDLVGGSTSDVVFLFAVGASLR